MSFYIHVIKRRGKETMNHCLEHTVSLISQEDRCQSDLKEPGQELTGERLKRNYSDTNHSLADEQHYLKAIHS
jgi:hypothetical protein